MIFHTPVLLKEAIDFLNVQPGEKYIDATVGGGGHAAAMLGAGGVVLGIDADPEAVEFARERLAAECQMTNDKCQIVQGNFRNVNSIAKEHGFDKVGGILFDLGMSSWQIESSGRGFSFLKNEPLDMRMDPTLSVRAEDLLAGLTEKELGELFSKFAQEKRSRAIARAVAFARRLRAIKTTQELSGLLAWVELGEPQEFWDWYQSVFSRNPGRFGSFDRRARIFQALRIVVNDEINSLREALPRALQLLKVEGRLVVISFHSLEDRVVKDFGRSTPEVKPLTKKPLSPSKDEIGENPRARSARLRAFERAVVGT